MRLALLPLFLCSLPVLAVENGTGATGGDPLSAGYLLKLIIGLLLVLGLIFLFAWAARKMRLAPGSDDGMIRVLSAISVGQRDRIALIQVGEEQILVGLSPGRMQTLHTLKEPLVPQQSQEPSASSFADRLNRLMNPPGSCR